MSEVPSPPAGKPRPVRKGTRVRPPGRSPLKVDPRVIRKHLDATLKERLVDEAREGGWGWLSSLGVHLFLLLILWITVAPSHQLFGTPGGDDAINSGFEELKSDDDTPAVPIEVKRQPIFTNPIEPKPNDPPQKNNPGGGERTGPATVAVKPVDVKQLLDDRRPEVRDGVFEKLDPEKRARRAISRGLGWLKRQQLSSGKWELHRGYPDAGYQYLRTDTGATSLALLAFLGAGYTHKAGGYEDVVGKGLAWLLGIQKPNGDFHDFEELGRATSFYAHSQATIVVCEAYAMTGDKTLKEPAQLAVRYLLKSQHPVRGGWKYQPLDKEAKGDLSVTGWALMALHTARAAGMDVPEDDFKRSMLFLESVSTDDGARYKYEHDRPDSEVTLTMTAEGLLCRQFLGWPKNHAPLTAGVAWLASAENRPQWLSGGTNVPHAYSWYYTAQLLHNMGGNDWQSWYFHTRDLIVGKQVTSGNRKKGKDVVGSWRPKSYQRDLVGDAAYFGYGRIGGRLYTTAMCLLVLETPIRHRSIYE